MKNTKKKNEEDLSPWYYGNFLLDDIQNPNSMPVNAIGFVYIIENIKNGKKYIGKKLLTKAAYKQSKGKKKKKIRKESNWRNYFGSNQELLDDVAKFGKENFHRHIIKFCSSKGELSYTEAHQQFIHQVLLSDKYYNSWIQCKIHKKHVKGLKK